MRRLAFLTALLAALVAASPSSGAVLLANNCGSRCTDFNANGSGGVSVVGNGAEWGSITSGTVWVRDRTGRANPRNWVHGSGKIAWKYLGGDGWRASSKQSMVVNATGTSFWVKVQGTGVQMCSVVDGSGAIAGKGRYVLNGRSHSWPGRTTSLHF